MWAWVSLRLLKQRIMEVVVTTTAISHAKLQLNYHHQQTNSKLFTGRMPFLSPNQQLSKHWKGTILHFHGLAYPKLTWGLSTLSRTTNSSWLPWGGLPCLSSALWCQYPNTHQVNNKNKKVCVPKFREHLHTIMNTSIITSSHLLQDYPAAWAHILPQPSQQWWNCDLNSGNFRSSRGHWIIPSWCSAVSRQTDGETSTLR